MTTHEKALARFTEYFVRNYPGPHTVIGDPKWHAPRIFRAALYALAGDDPPEILKELLTFHEERNAYHEMTGSQAEAMGADECVPYHERMAKHHAVREKETEALLLAISEKAE